jgi:hypothetical protein
MVESRLSKPLAIAAILVALVLGVLLGMASGVVDRLFGGPDPKTIATSSLESMRAQNRLITFVARYVSVVSSEQQRLGGLVSTERTLILPGNVRYEVDLSRLQAEDVRWDAGSQPEVDLKAAREYGSGGVLANLTSAETRLDATNRSRAVADLREQAKAELPMRLARDSARQAIERSFSMPLKAAGFENARVVARFAFEDGADPSYLDRSTPYNEAIADAERRRAQGN